MPKSRKRTRGREQGEPPTPVLAENPLPAPVEEWEEPEAIPPLEAQVPSAPEGSVTPRMLVNSITVEVAAYGLILLASVALRLAALGGRPLAPHEAAAAISAWDFLQGKGGALSGSPFLFSANLLSFMLAGPTDTTARLIPALLGSSIVLLPLLLRRELGRGAALGSSILLLLSTSLVYYARDLNGTEIGAIAGYFAAVFFWRRYAYGLRRDLYLGALCAAVSLTAGSSGYTVLASGIVFLLLFYWLTRRNQARVAFAADGGEGNGFEPSGNGREKTARPVEWRNAAILFGTAFLVLSTAFFMNRGGLGGAFNLFGDWVGMFSSLGPLADPLDLLLVYEPLLLVFGLAGLLLIVNVTGRELANAGIAPYFAVAALVGLLLYSIAGVKEPANTVVIAIPLAILAGWFIASLLENGMEEIRRAGGLRALIAGEVPLLVVSLMVAPLVYLQLTGFLSRNAFSPGVETFYQLLAPGAPAGSFEPAALLLGLLTLVIVVFLALLSVGSVGTARTANLAAGIIALLMFLSSVRALWLATYWPASVSGTRAELIAGEQTSLQARDLRKDLEWESEWLADDEHSIHILADPGLGPVVEWYLSGFANVQWASTSQVPGGVQAVITGDNAAAPAGSWESQRYDLVEDWQLQDASRSALFKWLVLRDGGVPVWQTVRLWVPTPTTAVPAPQQ